MIPSPFFGSGLRVFELIIKGWLIWFGYRMLKEIWKAWKKDHTHDRNWSFERYMQHIKEEHPDIWEEHMNGDEELDEKK